MFLVSPNIPNCVFGRNEFCGVEEGKHAVQCFFSFMIFLAADHDF